MTTTKITALPALSSASSDDILPIVDFPGSNPVTKKITIAALFTSPVITTNIVMSAANLLTDTTTGMMIATSTTQKIGFYGATPIVRGIAYTQNYSTASHTMPFDTATAPPAGGTGATAGAYDTAAHRDAMIASLTNCIADVDATKKVVNAIINDLQALGLFA